MIRNYFLKLAFAQILCLGLLVPYVCGTGTCLPPPTLSTPCTAVTSWKNLTAVVKKFNSTDPLILCPFSITQADNSTTLEITNSISILCRDSRKCKLSSSTNIGNSLVRIRGVAAQVLLQGFVFSGAGKTFSAVQVAPDATQAQTFCDCAFQANMGITRGIALRVETGTNVTLEKCLFQDNSPLDMGSVFNRGSMIITNNVFQNNNGTGSAIAASRGSSTILQDNTFLSNSNGVPVLFPDLNYVDAGGNQASGNSLCNGIFTRNKCINLPNVQSNRTLSPIAPTQSPTSPKPTQSPTMQPSTYRAKCELVNPATQPCVDVLNWSDFRQKVEDGNGTVVFCPFNITKGRKQPVVYITSSIRLVCAVPKQCRLNSGTRHVMVNSWLGAQVYIQGFVFQGATNSSVRFLHNYYDVKPQTLCNCAFFENKATNRGAALWIEEGNTVTVSNSLFVGNLGTSFGGAIFNSGQLDLIESRFIGNYGPGSALASSLGSHVSMIANTFTSNGGRNPVYFQGINFTDLGGNIASLNNGCNGIFITDQTNRCRTFSSVNVQVTSGPTSPPISSVRTSFPTTALQPSNGTTPRGGPGYFNYNPSDSQYGPMFGGWKSVTDNAQYIRWNALSDQHQRSLANKCDSSLGQSPIDLCENYLNADCIEHHQTRSHSGNVSFGEQVTPQILPSMLRLLYYPDQTPEGGPYPPEADFALNWNGFMAVNNIDVKIPSEHTICGKRYPAEYSIFMLHSLKRQTLVMSILMDFDPEDKDNYHFQVAIDQWQAVFDATASKCNGNTTGAQDTPISRRMGTGKITTETVLEKRESTRGSSEQTRSVYENDDDDLDDRNLLMEQRADGMRSLTDTSPFGTGGWDPFHPSLKTSIYHWGYWGSLTEPPCSTFFTYRVVTTPAYISRRQWNQMRNILFNYKDENCTKTSVDYQGSVARPIQPLADRPLYKCSRSDYVSDAEKAEIRIDNPNYCC